MINWILGTFLAFGYVILYWLLGASVPEKYQTHSIPVMCVTGFLIYYALFQIIALPMKIMQRSLSELTIVWGGIMILMVLYIGIYKRWHVLESVRKLIYQKDKWLVVVISAIFACGVAVWLGLNTNTVSLHDSCNYIGLPVSSTYSNTLDLMRAYDGVLLTEPEGFYILNTDTLHSAVIYQALNIHPLIERKWSFTIAMVIIFEMTIYLIGKILFKGEQAKVLFFGLLANLILFYSFSLAGVSHYFAYRTYEGKSITSYQYTVLITLFAVSVYKQKKHEWAWIGMFLAAASAPVFCNTAIFVVPVMIGCMMFPYVIFDGIMKKEWQILKKYISVLIPGAVWIGIYMII